MHPKHSILDSNRLNGLIENIPGIIYSCAMDENWTMEYINTGIFDLTGYAAESFINNRDLSFASIIHPDDADRVEKSVMEAVKSQRAYTIEYRILDIKQQVIWVYEKGRAQYNREGSPLWLDGAILDITERKTIEHIDLLTQRLLTELAQETPLITALTHVCESIEQLWPKLKCAILTQEPDSYNTKIIGPGLSQKYIDEIIQYYSSNGLSTGNQTKTVTINQQLEYIFQQIGLYPCLTTEIKGPNQHTNGLITLYSNAPKTSDTLQQVTMQKVSYFINLACQKNHQDEELRRTKYAAEQASNAKTEFLSRMSHELRTPLNAILGFSQLIKLDNDFPEKHRDGVQEIHTAGNHLLSLVNEVLDLSSIETGNAKITSECIDTSDIVGQSIKLVSPAAKKKNITVINKTDSKTHIQVHADPLRLKQILINYLSNAIKYGDPDGTVILSINAEEHKIVRFNITDDGPGLSLNQCARLFKPFERLGHANSSIEGNGIGLVTCKNLAQLMNGQVGVTSKPGIGSTFWVDLPKCCSGL